MLCTSDCNHDIRHTRHGLPTVQAKVKQKAPYSQYDSLEKEGVKIHWGSPSDSSAIPSGDFDIVYDNNGKDMDACKPLIDAFKVMLLNIHCINAPILTT